MKKFYCSTCKEIKRRREVKKIDCEGYLFYTCKWCHENVINLDTALEKVLAKNNKLFKSNYIV